MNCHESTECPFLYQCLSNVCVHKDLFFPNILETFTIFLLCITSIISTIGGVGGGVFFFPILIAIFRFDPKEAVAISLTSVAGILTVRYIMSIPERNLRRDKPLINYDISIIYCPSIIIGTIFGVMMNRASPNWLLLTLVSISMGITFWETWKKGGKYRAEEVENEKAQKAAFANLNDIEMKHIKKIHDLLDQSQKSCEKKHGENASEKSFEMKNIKKIPENADHSEKSSVCFGNSKICYSELESDVVYNEPHKPLTKSLLRKYEKSLFTILEEESKIVPNKKLYILLINMAILTIFFCLQGNKTTRSIIGIPYCEVEYWVLQFAYIPFGLLILFFSVRLLNREYEEKVSSGYLFLPSDIQWDKRTAITSIFLGLIIGFTAAILGVGGAMIAGPVLLRLGFHPQEATYTASFMATFTAVAGALQYVLAGMVKWDYSIMCFVVGMFGLIVGMNYVMAYIKRQNKASIIIYCLAVCIGFSTLVLIFSGIEKTIEDFQLGRMLTLKDIC